MGCCTDAVFGMEYTGERRVPVRLSQAGCRIKQYVQYLLLLFVVERTPTAYTRFVLRATSQLHLQHSAAAVLRKCTGTFRSPCVIANTTFRWQIGCHADFKKNSCFISDCWDRFVCLTLWHTNFMISECL